MRLRKEINMKNLGLYKEWKKVFYVTEINQQRLTNAVIFSLIIPCSPK